MKKGIKISLWVIVALFLLITFGGGYYMVGFALHREDPEEDFIEEREKVESRCPGILAWWDDLEAKGILKDTTIITPDGRRLYANYAAAPCSKKTVILLHGYTNNPVTMSVLARIYRDQLGFNVFIPCLHAHGKSDGEYIQMGWKDKEDVKLWIPIAHELFKDEAQVVHGISMGAATTMMLSGDPTPDYVKAFVEDAGYTSVYEMFKDQLKEQFGLPPFPILTGASIITKVKLGWGFKEASSVKQLAKCEKPMFFIHGDADDFVPTAMMQPCYDAKVNGYKEYWLVPGSKHVFTYIDYPEEYAQRLDTFFKNINL